MSALAQALLEFQKKSPDLQKDAINPHFGKRFLSLHALMEGVIPIANGCGLVVSQFPTTVENGGGPKPALRTRITHAESGEFLEDVMLLMADKDGPQAQGSALTYARRYSLMAALGLVADEDDDGNTASAPTRDTTDALVEAAQSATKPSEMPVHFGKNRGVLLGSLTSAQLRWYATEWKVQDEPSDYDHRLKAAAVALSAGDDRPIEADVALGTPIA